jgi:hypothetical protein
MKIKMLKNKCMGRTILFIMGVVFLIPLQFSCNSGDSNKRLIPTKALVNVLTELYIADGLLAYPPIRLKFSAKDSTSNYMDIIERHGFSKERMDYTMRYYFEKKPEKLENIYDQVLTKLNEKQALLEKETPPPPPMIASNLWNGPSYFAVPESGIKDPVWFSIPIKDTGNFVLEFTSNDILLAYRQFKNGIQN